MTAAKRIAVRTGAVLCSIWLAGCNTLSQPQTAAEFRNGLPNKETFEVNRSLAQVGASFKRLASECLSKTVRNTFSQPGVSYQSVTYAYKPTVHMSASMVELRVQRSASGGGIIHVIKEPEGGNYLLIANARPVSATKTRIDLYRPLIGFSQLVQAVRDWSSGTSVPCLPASDITGF